MDYYELLGIRPNATTDEIKKAYKKIARENHPDATGNDESKTEFFKKATAAYETLSNDRARYDAKRPKPVKSRPSSSPIKTSSIKYSIVPPDFDIWGNPLSSDEKELWILQNMPNPPLKEIKELTRRIEKDRVKKTKKDKKNKEKEFEFYNNPEDSVYTDTPIDGMHFHNPKFYKDI